MRQFAFGILHALWRRLPVAIRLVIIALTQTRFTVGVTGVVIDPDESVLMVRNRFRQGGGWQLPGGFVKDGENLEAALVRELREEVGIEVEVGSVLTARLPRKTHLDVSYLCHTKQHQIEIDRGELLEADFFPLHALPAGLASEHRSLLEVARLSQ